MISKPIVEFLGALLNETHPLLGALDTQARISSGLDQFRIRYCKERVTKAKLNRFPSLALGEARVYLGHLLRYASPEGFACQVLPKRFWETHDLNQSVSDPVFYILQNNDLAGIDSQSLLKFSTHFLTSENQFLIVWDTDNHHWSFFSSLLCLISDFYFPAHLERLSVLHSINSFIPMVVPVGSRQWSVSFLEEHQSFIREEPRDTGPWGLHHFYPHFEMRNSIIKTLGEKFPLVGFADVSKINQTEEESFKQWAHYKSHFCAAVGGDLPYRVFDALITGGVAIVPADMRTYFNLFSIDDRAVIFYRGHDVFEPDRISRLIDNLFATVSRDHDYLESLVSRFHISNFSRKIFLCLQQILNAGD